MSAWLSEKRATLLRRAFLFGFVPFLAGCLGFGLVVFGISAFLLFPIIGFFGVALLPLVWGMTAGQWWLARRVGGRWMLALSLSGAAGVMFLLGPEGANLRLSAARVMAGVVTAGVSALMLRLEREHPRPSRRPDAD